MNKMDMNKAFLIQYQKCLCLWPFNISFTNREFEWWYQLSKKWKKQVKLQVKFQNFH